MTSKASQDRQDTDQIVALSVELVRQATVLAAGLAAAGGLNATDLTALRALDVIAEGDLPAGALGQALGLSSSSTTGLVDRLERAGLATRQPDPSDRRRVLVSLTPRARSFGAEHLAPYLHAITAAAVAVPPGHRASVRNFLTAITSPEPTETVSS